MDFLIALSLSLMWNQDQYPHNRWNYIHVQYLQCEVRQCNRQGQNNRVCLVEMTPAIRKGLTTIKLATIECTVFTVTTHVTKC